MVPRKQRQITRTEQGHILTNSHVWSPDSQWIVYDVRSDPAGSLFDGGSIERVHVGTGKVETLYRSQRGAKCGVATYSPIAETVVFILGPELPTDDWQYAPYHRQGVLVDTQRPGVARRLDARNILPPLRRARFAGVLMSMFLIRVDSGLATPTKTMFWPPLPFIPIEISTNGT